MNKKGQINSGEGLELIKIGILLLVAFIIFLALSNGEVSENKVELIKYEASNLSRIFLGR